jgi:hypothetical protein
MQHPPGAAASATCQPSKHVRRFEAAANLNLGSDLVLQEVGQLKKLGEFHHDFAGQFVKGCQFAVEELRAWAIFEVTEDLHRRAQHDWAHYGRLRLRWENKFRDPGDILNEAARLEKRLAEDAPKKEFDKKKPKERTK